MENITAILGQLPIIEAEKLPETVAKPAREGSKSKKSKPAKDRQGIPRHPRAVRSFVKLPSNAYLDTRLSPMDLRVLILIISSVGGKDYWAVPQREGLAELLGVSERTVKRAIKNLAQLGYLVIERTPGWNRYYLTPSSDPNCPLVIENQNPEITSEVTPMALPEVTPMALTLTRENELDETVLVGEYTNPKAVGVPSQLVEADSSTYSDSFRKDFPAFQDYLEAVTVRLSRLCETNLDLTNGSKAVEKSLKALRKAYDWQLHPKEIEVKAVDYFNSPKVTIKKTRAGFLATSLAVILDHTPMANRLPSPSYCPNCGKPQDFLLGLCGNCAEATVTQSLETLLEAPETPSEGFQPVAPETLQGILSTHYPTGLNARKINQ